MTTKFPGARRTAHVKRQTLALGAPWRHEARETLRLAAPIVLTQLAWVSMTATDTAMIGRLGATALAGASLSMMMFFLAYIACFGVVMATAGLIAQAYGAHRPRTLRRIVRQGLWVTIALTLPALGALGFTGAILAALNQPAEALAPAEAYMDTLRWALPGAVAFMVLRNFVAALNRPAVALWVACRSTRCSTTA
jgi:MATE family multidrug resistance protein